MATRPWPLVLMAGCDLGPPVCPEYSGIVDVGTRWEYALVYDGERELETWEEVVEIDRSTGLVVIEQGRDDPADEHDSWDLVQVRHEYRCDGTGLWYLGWTDFWYADEQDTIPEVDDSMVIEQPGWLQLPRTVGVGYAWSTEGEWTWTAADGAEATVWVSLDYEVLQEAEVRLASGDYTALEVECEQEGMPPSTGWYAPGVGLVSAGDKQLTAYTP